MGGPFSGPPWRSINGPLWSAPVVFGGPFTRPRWSIDGERFVAQRRKRARDQGVRADQMDQVDRLKDQWTTPVKGPVDRSGWTTQGPGWTTKRTTPITRAKLTQ